MDAATGVCVNKSFPACVTASLTTNYKRYGDYIHVQYIYLVEFMCEIQHD